MRRWQNVKWFGFPYAVIRGDRELPVRQSPSTCCVLLCVHTVQYMCTVGGERQKKISYSERSPPKKIRSIKWFLVGLHSVFASSRGRVAGHTLHLDILLYPPRKTTNFFLEEELNLKKLGWNCVDMKTQLWHHRKNDSWKHSRRIQHRRRNRRSRAPPLVSAEEVEPFCCVGLVGWV